MEISITGIDSAIKTVAKYIAIEAKLANIAKRLCEVGEPIIRQTHGHHARVWYEEFENGYRIVAEGQDILFIEFGTGNLTGTMSEKYDAVPQVALEPGSWSKAHQGEYWKTGGYRKGHWHFAGEEYTETPPHPAFYYAYQAMVQALPQIAAEELQK